MLMTDVWWSQQYGTFLLELFCPACMLYSERSLNGRVCLLGRWALNYVIALGGFYLFKDIINQSFCSYVQFLIQHVVTSYDTTHWLCYIVLTWFYSASTCFSFAVLSYLSQVHVCLPVYHRVHHLIFWWCMVKLVLVVRVEWTGMYGAWLNHACIHFFTT